MYEQYDSGGVQNFDHDAQPWDQGDWEPDDEPRCAEGDIDLTVNVKDGRGRLQASSDTESDPEPEPDVLRPKRRKHENAWDDALEAAAAVSINEDHGTPDERDHGDHVYVACIPVQPTRRKEGDSS